MTAYLKRFVFILCVITLGCGKDDESIPAPSNLNVSLEVAQDGSGLVTVNAVADNATIYKTSFGEKSPDLPIQSSDGKSYYTYAKSGTYTISVVAENSAGQSITQNETVKVDVFFTIPTTGYSTPDSYSGMSLVWSDEFNGAAINENDWTFEIGNNNGWGNQELQYYKKENAALQDGHLIITAKKEAINGYGYTSSRMITKGKKEFKYGRVDIRALLPKGQGLWPALWMLGSNIDAVGWPKCGEIDIMEMVGGQGREKTVKGTLHWDNAGTRACTCDKPGYSLSSGIFADEFHVFSIVWDETLIKWYVDDIEYLKIDITPQELSEFHNDYFFIFNVAVGGLWPGSPDGSTQFPQRMVVDYVRVFQPQ